MKNTDICCKFSELIGVDIGNSRGFTAFTHRPHQESHSMPQAIWNNTVIAESDSTEVVEGNHYFPPDSIHRKYFRESGHSTVCGWKGTASYYDLVMDDATNEAAAWYYADPKPEADSIKGYIAFWKGVQVNA